MKVPNTLMRRIRPPRLTRWRIVLALVVAVTADGLQLSLLGTPPFVEIVDAIAMVLVSWLIGLHILLLPTFVLELIPVVDTLPTWTGCTLAVIVLRRREERLGASNNRSAPGESGRQRDD